MNDQERVWTVECGPNNPWMRNRDGIIAEFHITPGPGLTASHSERRELALRNARYAAAAWNGCKEAGLSTEVLESGALSDLVNAAVAYVGATLQRRTTDDHFEALHDAARAIARERLREWEEGAVSAL